MSTSNGSDSESLYSTGVMQPVFLTWLVVVNGKAIELNVANAQYTYSTYIAIASYRYTIKD